MKTMYLFICLFVTTTPVSWSQKNDLTKYVNTLQGTNS